MAVSIQNEKSVVNSHAQPYHCRQYRSETRNLQEQRNNQNQHLSGCKPNDRNDNRHPSSNNGSESDQQNNDGNKDSDCLTRWRLLPRVFQNLPVGPDCHRGRICLFDLIQDRHGLIRWDITRAADKCNGGRRNGTIRTDGRVRGRRGREGWRQFFLLLDGRLCTRIVSAGRGPWAVHAKWDGRIKWISDAANRAERGNIGQQRINNLLGLSINRSPVGGRPDNFCGRST